MKTNTPPEKISCDFLKSIYLDATATIRHYDSERASFAKTFISILSILTSLELVSISQNLQRPLLSILSGITTLLSFFLIFAIQKFASLIILQKKRAIEAMNLFQKELDSIDFSSINHFAKKEALEEEKVRLSVNSIWTTIFCFVSLANFSVFLYSLN